jgi:hypothetical protein
LISADIVKEGNRAAIAAIEEKMQEIGMIVRPPSSGGNGVHQRQPEQIAIEADSLG